MITTPSTSSQRASSAGSARYSSALIRNLAYGPNTVFSVVNPAITDPQRPDDGERFEGEALAATGQSS
jgi:hypothetical protein